MERAQKIEHYGQAHDLLVAALKRFPREMWQYKPAPDQWSIHETVVHITDSEANSYVRARRFIVEPGKMVMGYDESAWAQLLHYHDQNTEDALELFRMLRGQTYKLIRQLPESVWAHTVEHSESGVMTMEDWLDIYTRHIPEHVAQMEGVYAAWQARPSGE